MQKRTAKKSQIQKQRDPKKVERVLKLKGYPDGLPEGKQLHHIVPVALGGKTTPKNTAVLSKKKHQQIHKNSRKIGKI